jgi:hypothetical protein
MGASLEVLHGSIVENREGRGAYGGNDIRLHSQSLSKYWKESRALYPDTFCVINGQFFYAPEYPTRLPLPLKKDGVILGDGYARNEFEGQKLMLEIWPDRANIVELTQEALYNSDAPDIVGGLTYDAPKRRTKAVARTFVGVSDANGDGQSEILLVFNTLLAKPEHAVEVLTGFGASQVMMLDGGGSTQLLCKGESLIRSERAVPQALAIVAAPGEIVSADQPEVQAVPVAEYNQQEAAPAENAGEDLVQVPMMAEEPLAEEPVDLSDESISEPPLDVSFSALPAAVQVIQGGTAQLQFDLVNTGGTTWTPGEHALELADTPWGKVERIPIQEEVAPGGTARFVWGTPPLYDEGSYLLQASLVHGEEALPGGTVALLIDVLPREGEKLLQTERDASAWKPAVEMAEPLPEAPVIPGTELEQAAAPNEDRLGDVVLIPALMSPVIALLVLLIGRYRMFR